MQKIIERKARYKGTEHPYLKEVVIIKAMISNGSENPDDHLYLDNDADIAAAGGVKPTDRVEVQPILPDGRRSWVTSDPLFKDLELLD